MHKCDLCEAAFCEEATLRKHRLRDHRLSPEAHLALTPPRGGAGARGSETSGKRDKFGQLCVYCNQTFKTKAELERHMKSHVTPSNQKCNICDEVFPSAGVLAEHKLSHCKVVRGNVCVVCKASVHSEEQFYAHAQQHGFQGTAMQCVVCRQTLASMLELQIHGRHHFARLSCCVCLKAFDSKESLISKLNASGRPYYVCKSCYRGDGEPSSCLTTDPPSSLGGKTYQCIKCQQSFGSEQEIQRHVASHVMQEGNVHECLLCSRTFESPAKLQCHLIEHSFESGEEGGTGALACYLCPGASFSSAAELQQHSVEHGLAARQFACSRCPQRFFFSAELKNHMQAAAHSPRPTPRPSPSLTTSQTQMPSAKHQCPECSKTFINQAALSSHLKVRPFCPFFLPRLSHPIPFPLTGAREEGAWGHSVLALSRCLLWHCAASATFLQCPLHQPTRRHSTQR